MKNIFLLTIGLTFFGIFLIFLIQEFQPQKLEVREVAAIPEPEEMIIELPPMYAMQIPETEYSDTLYIIEFDTVYVHHVDTVYVNRLQIDFDSFFDNLNQIFGSIEMLFSLLASGLAFYKLWESNKQKKSATNHENDRSKG